MGDAPPNVASDFFYFVDFDILLLWWSKVEDQAERNYKQWPYPDYFMFKEARLLRMHFPVVIVRSSKLVECCRGFGDRNVGSVGRQMVQSCSWALRGGLFSSPAGFMEVELPLANGRLETCNQKS